MNTNKILLTSLISISFLFTGFKPKMLWTISLPEYENYTYEQVLKEERLDSTNKPYTYFEYNFTNIGEGYIETLVVVPFKTVRAEQKKDGDILQSYYSFLTPGASAVYYFSIYDYADEEISFEAHGYGSDQLASNVTYSNFNLEYVGTPGNSDGVYTYSYVFTMDISYDKYADFDYSEYLFVNYKDATYCFSFSSKDAWVNAKEEMDEEQISASAVVFQQDRILLPQDYYNGPNLYRLLNIIFIVVFALPLSAALIPPVILIVDKCKKSKAKKS